MTPCLPFASMPHHIIRCTLNFFSQEVALDIDFLFLAHYRVPYGTIVRDSLVKQARTTSTKSSFISCHKILCMENGGACAVLWNTELIFTHLAVATNPIPAHLNFLLISAEPDTACGVFHKKNQTYCGSGGEIPPPPPQKRPQNVGISGRCVVTTGCEEVARASFHLVLDTHWTISLRGGQPPSKGSKWQT